MSLLTKWQFCTEGNYGNLDLCRSIPFAKPNVSTLTSSPGATGNPTLYAETVYATADPVARRSHLYFFVTNCEVWGTDQEETRFGGTRYPESCRASTAGNFSTSVALERSEHAVSCPNLKPSYASLQIEKTFRNSDGFLSFTDAPF